MKPFWKSKTFIGLFVMLAASMPALSDPIWQVMLDAGLPSQAVAWAKLLAYFGGAAGVAYGRVKAQGGVGL